MNRLEYWKMWKHPDFRSYQARYHCEAEFKDASIIEKDCDGRQGAVLFALNESNLGAPLISNWGAPMFVWAEPGFEMSKSTSRVISEYLREFDVESFTVFDILNGGLISPFSSWLLTGETGFRAETGLVMDSVIDLTQDESVLRRRMRKSYRNLVNVGARDWSISHYIGSDSKREDFDSFQQLHREVAGRVTRSQESWDYQWNRIFEGNALVVEAHDSSDELIAASLFDRYDDVWSYSVSAARRDLFDKPVNHTLIWQGLLKAKELGGEVFYLGPSIPVSENEMEEKLSNIYRFKRGFGGLVHPKMCITMKRIEDA